MTMMISTLYEFNFLIFEHIPINFQIILFCSKMKCYINKQYFTDAIR